MHHFEADAKWNEAASGVTRCKSIKMYVSAIPCTVDCGHARKWQEKAIEENVRMCVCELNKQDIRSLGSASKCTALAAFNAGQRQTFRQRQVHRVSENFFEKCKPLSLCICG